MEATKPDGEDLQQILAPLKTFVCGRLLTDLEKEWLSIELTRKRDTSGLGRAMGNVTFNGLRR